MWQKQFSAKPEPKTPLYIVGDIHGRCDLLIRLVAMIDADAESREIDDHVVVFVGDYVDRGPQSALVLNVVSELKADASRRIVTLKGNHEDMMLKFMNESSNGSRWIKNGGYETLLSFGINGCTEDSEEPELEDARKRLNELLGKDSRTLLESLDTSYKNGNIFVAHAGADPTKGITKQEEQHLIWGAPKFKTRKRKDKFWVAHGHFAESKPSVEAGRISTDTGAYFSNQLTAARVLSGQITFMTAES